VTKDRRQKIDAKTSTPEFRGSANGFLRHRSGAGLAGGSDRRRDDGASRLSLPDHELFFAQGFNWCKSCAMILLPVFLPVTQQRKKGARYAT
tara:strand:- start:3289 stop:3564 length:276 start_codon:yes stop_codon:yes gene_type:complete